MKFLIASFLFITASLQSVAQNSCTIKKAYAFYNASMPGVQMVDENGSPIPVLPMYTRFIYVEYTGSKMPEIKTVLYNNVILLFSIESVKEKTVLIGDQSIKPNNIINAKKGNSFLKIIVHADLEKTMPEIDCKNIVIKSKFAGKRCTFYVTRETAFASLPRY